MPDAAQDQGGGHVTYWKGSHILHPISITLKGSIAMRHALAAIILPALLGCTGAGFVEHRSNDLIGLDSFRFAARYGTPDSYQLQGEYMQLNYGSVASGCRVIVLIDQDQRVVGWAGSGARCMIADRHYPPLPY